MRLPSAAMLMVDLLPGVQQAVDLSLEHLVRSRPLDLLPVDEECGRGVDPASTSLGPHLVEKRRTAPSCRRND